MTAHPVQPPAAAEDGPALPWLYRSEAFPEDLSDWQALADAQDDTRSLPARLTWPLSALVLCLGLVVGFGWA